MATGTYIRGTADVAEGLARIQAAAAEAVVMIGTYEPCARFISLDLGVASPLSFSASDHQGLERVYLTHVKDGFFQWLQERTLSPELKTPA